MFNEDRIFHVDKKNQGWGDKKQSERGKASSWSDISLCQGKARISEVDAV